MLNCAVPVVCVIPARVGSTRLPCKPLRLLGGEPLIQVVARRAVELLPAARVVVASDDDRVLKAVGNLEVTPMLTSNRPRSGTERVAEAVRGLGLSSDHIVVNLQGDQPFATLEMIDGSIGMLEGGFDIGTAAAPLTPDARSDPARVKVVRDASGAALWFGRELESRFQGRAGVELMHHIGVYVYRVRGLERWLRAPPVPGETLENLEQLRPLARGQSIGVARVAEAPLSIDTEQDLAEALSNIQVSNGVT